MYFIIIIIKFWIAGVVGAPQMILRPFFFFFSLHFPRSFDIVCVIMYNIAFIDLFLKIVGRFLYLHLSPSWDRWRDIRSRLVPPCRVLNSSMLKHFPRRKPLVTFFFFFFFLGGGVRRSICVSFPLTLSCPEPPRPVHQSFFMVLSLVWSVLQSPLPVNCRTCQLVIRPRHVPNNPNSGQ